MATYVCNLRKSLDFILTIKLFLTDRANKRKGPHTSLWELTVSERANAALIIENTTATPFFYCRYYFKCFFCKEHYKDINLLLQHTSAHAPVQTEIKNLLTKGMKTIKIDISELKCRVCAKHFPDVDKVREHLTRDHAITFTESGNGVMAFNLATSNGQFRCYLCRKLFQTFILVNRHMNVHFSNAVCDICGSAFASHLRLVHHKAIHTGGHPCDICKKIYTTSTNLKRHKAKTHELERNVRTLRCTHCPERFAEHFKKLNHLKDAHGVTFTFECDNCNSIFDSRRALTAHTNKFHTDKTKCRLCSKSFTSVTSLKMHVVSHSGERNHACSICDKKYRYKKSVRDHMRSHCGDNGGKFSCPTCASGFSCRNELKDHFKEFHSKSYFATDSCN